jgi:ABC-type amino acid transport system permease subunit
MRYLFDLSPALILLSTMFVDYHVQSFEKKLHAVKILSTLWVLTSVLTVVLGFLIGFTGSQNNFLNKNPQLYYQLVEWFRR